MFDSRLKLLFYSSVLGRFLVNATPMFSDGQFLSRYDYHQGLAPSPESTAQSQQGEGSYVVDDWQHTTGRPETWLDVRAQPAEWARDFRPLTNPPDAGMIQMVDTLSKEYAQQHEHSDALTSQSSASQAHDEFVQHNQHASPLYSSSWMVQESQFYPHQHRALALESVGTDPYRHIGTAGGLRWFWPAPESLSKLARYRPAEQRFPISKTLMSNDDHLLHRINSMMFDNKMHWVQTSKLNIRGDNYWRARTPFKRPSRLLPPIKASESSKASLAVYMTEHGLSNRENSILKDTDLDGKPHFFLWSLKGTHPAEPDQAILVGAGYIYHHDNEAVDRKLLGVIRAASAARA